ncbi:hypothetical protein MNBD_IGNAVI01-1022, partial [hydrothermal vent metagenome]
MHHRGNSLRRKGNDYKKLSFRQSLSRNLYLHWRFPLKTRGNDARNLNLFPNMLLTLLLLILFLSTSFAQTKSLHYQNFISLSDSTSNDTLIIKDVPIPSINVGDILGQMAASPISGLFFSLFGGIGGYIIEPTGHGGPSLP